MFVLITTGYFFPRSTGILTFFFILIGIFLGILYYIKSLSIKDKKNTVNKKKNISESISTKLKQEGTKNTSSKIKIILLTIALIASVLWTLLFIFRLFYSLVWLLGGVLLPGAPDPVYLINKVN